MSKNLAFGFERADIVTPGAIPVYHQIEGAKELELNYEMDTVEVEGDDAIIGYWHHNQKGSFTYKGAVIDLDVYAAVTGNIVGSDAGPPATEEILFGTPSELQPVELMFRFKQRAKDKGNSTGRDRYVYVYRAICKIKPAGMSKGKPAEVEITGNMLQSTTDEYAEALSEEAFGKQQFIDQ